MKAGLAATVGLAVLSLALPVLRADDLLRTLPRGVEGTEKLIGRQLRGAGVLAYWDFDDARPRERVGRAGSLNDGTRLVAGRRGSARLFLPREHGLIRTAFHLPALGENFSFSCWLRFPESLSDQQVFQYLAIRDGKLVLLLPGQQPLTVPAAVESGRFFHVAFTVDAAAARARAYIDGAPSGELALQPLKHFGEPLIFGMKRGSPPPSFAIDEVSLWGRPLTEKEIERLSRLRWSLGVHRAFFGLAAFRLGEAARGFHRAVLLTADLFNPFGHENRVYSAGLPMLTLAMSRNDIKYFTRYFNEQQQNGLNAPGSSKKRRVEIVEGERTRQAAMELLAGESPGPEGSAKRTFTLEILSDDGEPERKVLVRPIEGTSYLLEILAGKLARDCGLAVTAPELCAASVNGTFEGLYLCTESPRQPGSIWLGSPGDWQALLHRLPVFRDDVLGEFDRLVASFGGAITSDRKSPLTSREVLFDLRTQRRLLERELSDGTPRSEAALVARVADHLGEELFLGRNPHATLVVGDLDLAVNKINGATLAFASLTPALLGDDGRVTAPVASPTPAGLRVTIRSGQSALAKDLSFVILPGRRLPIMRVQSAGDPPIGSTVPTQVEIIEGDNRSSGLLDGRIRLRGNTSLYRERNKKKYYRIKLARPLDVPALGRTRHLFLISGWKDITLMRDRLCFDLFRSFSEPGKPRYSPHVRPVELVVNGDYKGIYNLMDRVDADLLGFDRKISGADRPVLYKALDSLAGFQEPHREAYLQKNPDWRDSAYWDPLEKLITFIGQSTSEAFRDGIERRVDVDNIIDFEILLTLTSNQEGRNTNLFLARDGGADARFFIVPWDYDMTFYNTTIPTNHLINRLHWELPGYSRRVYERWRALSKDRLSEQGLMSRIDDLEADLAEGIERNYRRWPLPGEFTLAGEVGNLRSFIRERLPRLEEHFKALAVP